MHVAVEANQGPAVDYLLSVGADANLRNNKEILPLHRAVELNRHELISVCITNYKFEITLQTINKYDDNVKQLHYFVISQFSNHKTKHNHVAAFCAGLFIEVMQLKISLQCRTLRK